MADSTAPAELVEDGITGFAAKDKEDFRRKLELLIEDRRLREIMGKNARSAALERSWNTVFDNLFEMYKDMLGAGLRQPD